MGSEQAQGRVRGQVPVLRAGGAVVEWRGASGTKYAYWAYELPEVPDQEAIGSYVFARLGPDGAWVPVFFGHGDLATLGEGVHALWAGLSVRGATHVHTHRNARVAERMDEEADLLAAYPEAYVPVGCNVREAMDGSAGG